jgi:hypothetical protein
MYTIKNKIDWDEYKMSQTITVKGRSFYYPITDYSEVCDISWVQYQCDQLETLNIAEAENYYESSSANSSDEFCHVDNAKALNVSVDEIKDRLTSFSSNVDAVVNDINSIVQEQHNKEMAIVGAYNLGVAAQSAESALNAAKDNVAKKLESYNDALNTKSQMGLSGAKTDYDWAVSDQNAKSSALDTAYDAAEKAYNSAKNMNPCDPSYGMN